jgi:hypothetical protein
MVNGEQKENKTRLKIEIKSKNKKKEIKRTKNKRIVKNVHCE